MSMTREEAAIKSCEDRIKHLESAPKHHYGKRQCERAIELERVKIAALRPVSRGQVEQVLGGMWIYDPDTGYAYCEMCKHTICQTDYLNGKLPPFCEMCGAPMTDEAVEMVMERLDGMVYYENNPVTR